MVNRGYCKLLMCTVSVVCNIGMATNKSSFVGAEKIHLAMQSPQDAFITSALVHQGVVPCSPIYPTAAFTIGALELFRIVWLCSPHFSIQAFVKTLCDLQSVSNSNYCVHLVLP